MKPRSVLSLLAIFAIGGAIFGFADASGILALLDSSRTRMRSGDWQPISKEEYRHREKTYPLYGAAIGLLLGVGYLVSTAKKKSENDDHGGVQNA